MNAVIDPLLDQIIRSYTTANSALTNLINNYALVDI